MRALLLIDGNGLAWRVVTGRGQAKVFYGLTRKLLELRQQFPGYRVVLVFDGGRSAFRCAVDPDYKAHRQMTPDRQEVVQGIRAAQGALEAIGANFIRVNGVEADDILSILACRAETQGYPAVIVSDDSDLYQCLGEHVSQWLPRQGRLITADEALAEWQGSKKSYVLWKALVGDSTDHIPGVRGIGPKRAPELIAICKGEWRRLFDERAKRLLADASWAQVLWEPGTLEHFARQVRLVLTARDYHEVAPEGDLTVCQLETAIERALDQLRNPVEVTEERWGAFMQRYDAFHLLADLPALEDLYAFRVERPGDILTRFNARAPAQIQGAGVRSDR